MGRCLVVMGLRGTLLERIHSSKVPLSMPEATLTVGMHKVWVRPNMDKALNELEAAGCDLAIWSSTTNRNTIPLIQTVLPEFEQRFKFIWTREHTAPDNWRRAAPIDQEDEHATIKDLNRVWSAFPQYSPGSTILVDDTPSKARANADNYLWLSSCCGENHADPNGMNTLLDTVTKKLMKSDVRQILPLRI